MFDVEGRLLYANQQAREALVGMDLSEHAPDLMPRLAALGGRLRPLRVGALELGEAMFIPGRRGPDHVGGPGKRGYRQDARREQLEARGDGQAPGHQPDHPLAPSQGVRATPRRPEQMGANLLVLLSDRRRPSSLPHPTPLLPTRAPPSSNSSSAPWPAGGRATRWCATTRRRSATGSSVGVGRRVWSKVPASAVEEQVARVQWQQPNDLRVDVIGRRFQTRNRTLQLSSVWDRPVVRPARRGRLGADLQQRLPGHRRAASAGELGPRVVSLRRDRGADSDARQRRGASPAPGGGHAETRWPGAHRGADVDRFGDARRWSDSPSATSEPRSGSGAEEGPRGPDSAKARRLNALANRIVSIDADLEYGLQEGRYWMPYRQVIAGRVRLPVVSDVVIPFQATTTFDDYTINGGHPIEFAVALPDTAGLTPRLAPGAPAGAAGLAAGRAARAGSARRPTACAPGTTPTAGRAAGTSCIARPTSTLDRYDAWPDSLSLEADPAEVRRLREAEEELGPAERGAAGFGHGSGGARLRRTSGCRTCYATIGCRASRSAWAIACGRRGSGSPTSTARCATG